MNHARPARLGTALAALAMAILACTAGSARSPETRAELAEFYAAWESEIRAAVADLEEDDLAQLRDIWPAAEFEGTTGEVLEVIATRPALQPLSRRLSRFLNRAPSNRVRGELGTETAERRLWTILVDTINDELGRPTSTAGGP